MKATNRFSRAMVTVYENRNYLFISLLSFLALLTLYLFLLPGAYTGGRIGLISFGYLNGTLIFFSVALSALASLTLTLNLYSFKLVSSTAGQGAGFISLISSILPGMLCCSPIVPTFLSLLGASTPTIFGLSGKIQGFFAANLLYFLIAALILLLWSFYLISGRIAGVCSSP